MQITQPLQNNNAINFRNRTLHMHHRPGHSPSDTVFHDREQRILIAANHLIGHISSNPLITHPRDGSGEQPSALLSYLESLDATQKIDVKLVLPGHGDPFSDHRRLIDERVARHRKRAEKILHVLEAQPRSAYEIAQKL